MLYSIVIHPNGDKLKTETKVIEDTVSTEYFLNKMM